MTVIPPERSGMASGVSGTVRFTGIVIGFAGLGAVLAARIKTVLSSGLSNLGANGIDHAAVTRRVVAGDLSGSLPNALSVVSRSLHSLALASFGAGFQAILFTAAAFAAVSAFLTWALVRREEH